MAGPDFKQAGPAQKSNITYAFLYIGGLVVTSISVTEARKRLFALVDEVGESHAPIEIKGKRGNAVLVSEDDWRAIQETLHLTAIPGMRESIVEGMATATTDLSEDPGW